MGELTFDLRQLKVIVKALKWAVDAPEGVQLPNITITDPYRPTELGTLLVNEWGYTEWTPNTVLTESN